MQFSSTIMFSKAGRSKQKKLMKVREVCNDVLTQLSGLSNTDSDNSSVSSTFKNKNARTRNQYQNTHSRSKKVGIQRKCRSVNMMRTLEAPKLPVILHANRPMGSKIVENRNGYQQAGMDSTNFNKVVEGNSLKPLNMARRVSKFLKLKDIKPLEAKEKLPEYPSHIKTSKGRLAKIREILEKIGDEDDKTYTSIKITKNSVKKPRGHIRLHSEYTRSPSINSRNVVSMSPGVQKPVLSLAKPRRQLRSIKRHESNKSLVVHLPTTLPDLISDPYGVNSTPL